MNERAVIYVPAGRDMNRWRRICVRYCEARGYRLIGEVITYSDADRWEDVQAMAEHGELDVLVACRREHLPPARRPRIEVTGEMAGRPAVRGGMRYRRPRIIR